MLESPLAPAGRPRPRPYARTSCSTGGETLELAGISFEVLNVPGHSPGHLAYAADGCLFSGDVLFAGGVGRVDIPGGDWDTLLESIRMLAERFPPETVVYSGHGPPTTLGRRARRATRSSPSCARAATEFQAPRGTHDVLPSDQPLVARRPRRWRS